MAEPKKLFIKTYGCQMNVYDSERMAEAMGADGYVMTDQADQAGGRRDAPVDTLSRLRSGAGCGQRTECRAQECREAKGRAAVR